MKTREICTPSEGGKCTAAGETLIQGALEAVTPPRTFGRWDENAGILRTFGRWECHGGRRNADTGRSRSSDDSHTFGRWDENTGILHTFGRWKEEVYDERACGKGPSGMRFRNGTESRNLLPL